MRKAALVNGYYISSRRCYFSPELIHELFLYGDEDAIRKRLYAMHQAGVDEIMEVIRPLKDAEREERALLERLASI